MSHWSFAASLPVMIFAAGAWLGAGWLGFLNWRQGGGGRRTAFLEGFKLLIVTLLGFTLLRPERVIQSQHTQLPEVAILCDASASMKTRDVLLEPSPVIAREEWLKMKKQVAFWKPLEKNSRVIVEEFSPPPTAAKPSQPAVEEGTDLNQALENALQHHKNLKAVLVLSDGDWNLGKSPVSAATRYRMQNIPIFAVPVGSPVPLPDLALLQVAPPSYGLLGEQIAIPFRIQSHLPRDVRTEVTLLGPKGVETKKHILLTALSQFQDSIVWSPRAAGEYTLTLKFPVEPEECLVDNNEQTFRIAVRSETLKVLVVDSLPRWEYRFLRNALARDPGVEMQCLLLHPGLSPGKGRNYLPAFPESKEALSKFDVIFLGDVGIGPGELKESDAQAIRGLVEQQGSGLVFLPGSRGSQLSLLAGSLGELYPVQLDPSKAEGLGFASESHLLLTSLGKGHLLTMLASDENQNQEIWKNLPGFFWCAAVQKNRPGTEVLAVHSTFRNSWGRIPLLVTRAAGNGKVLFMGTDSAWRWRRGVEDKYHYRFWSQVVRWMSHQRHLAHGQGLRLTFNPENPRSGETVFLQATVFDASGFPIEKGRVTARVQMPSKQTERLEFTPLEGGWGVFKSSFLPPQGGRYKLAISSDRAGGQLDTELLVAPPKREKPGQPANLAILQEIADLTHGLCGPVQELDSIVQKINLLPKPQPVEKRIRLWCHPWWGGFLLLLLTAYWTLRKFAGMV